MPNVAIWATLIGVGFVNGAALAPEIFWLLGVPCR